ncbi:MAG TPA: DUF5988 family protein [Streptosporangiaceae bacterium]|jgi:hypothetical protein
MLSDEKASVISNVLAVLEGGPTTLSDVARTQIVSAFTEKIKIPHYGGYEHFERTNELQENNHIIFRWRTRTEVAE